MAQDTLRLLRQDPETRRLAVIFAVVYFAQGMWYLPNLPITFHLKDTFGLSAAQTAAFFAITVIPWLIKPVYGLLSDFVPFTMAVWCVRDPRVTPGERHFRETWLAIHGAIGSRDLWIVAGFIFFYNFSPSFGPALIYYSTDILHFSKMFLGGLDSLAYASGIIGASLYFAYPNPFRSAG